LKEAVAKAVNLAPFTDAADVRLAAGTYDDNICLNDTIGTICSQTSVPGYVSLLLIGAGQAKTVIDGRSLGTVVSVGVDSNPVTLANLAVEDGASSSGGGVLCGGCTITLDEVSVSHNTATSFGAGIADDGGGMTIEGSTVSDNSIAAKGSATGAGIDITTGAQVTIETTTISGNSIDVTSPDSPGAVGAGVEAGDDSSSTGIDIIDSTITANIAKGVPMGGGLAFEEGEAELVGSTVSDNSAAGGDGGGVLVTSTGSQVRLGGDILDGNTAAAGSPCASSQGGAFVDLGYNVADGSTCGFGSTSKVSTDSAIALGALARNGGPALTEKVGKTSAAHDFVPATAKFAKTTFCSGTDERGVPRTQGPAKTCDSGAYQYAPPVIKSVSPDDGAPGTVVTLSGYGFDFCSLMFGSKSASASGSAPAFVKITTRVASLAAGVTTLKLINPDGTAGAVFTVLHALVVATSSLPSGAAGHAYSATLRAAGGKAPYAWRRAGGKLPPGITLGSGGRLSGQPTTKGDYSFVAAVTDDNHLTVTRSLSIDVS
jgi:hypothetical protein